MPTPSPLHLRLPATSANLGPGFDAVGLAMALHLTVYAVPSTEFAIRATGRDAELCAALENNLILTTYTEILSSAQLPILPLHLTLGNAIPLGMGCGSSAAALLCGVFLANHFGGLGWSPRQILDEACRREGHPDNVAACFHGAFTASATVEGCTVAATCGADLPWRLLLALPPHSLSTSKARALLPDTYPRSVAVTNIQATALLVSAFALGRPDLLRSAMADGIHQPFRSAACPLLPRLLPLASFPGVFGVALSGAGPSVLLLADPGAPLDPILAAIRQHAGDPSLEILTTAISTGASATPGTLVIG